MLIILNGMLKYHDVLKEIKTEKIYVTNYPRENIEDKQIVIEEVGFREGYMQGYSSTPYIYRLSEKYVGSLDIVGENVVVLINSLSGIDLGFSLNLLHRLSLDKNFRLTFIISSPTKKDNSDVKARFYAWIKLVYLYDIYINNYKEGLFKQVLVDSSNPPQLYKFLGEIACNTDTLYNLYSTIHIKFKRYIVPLADLMVLSELLLEQGKYRSIITEYKEILASLHKILDHAPTGLWSIARKYVELIRGSIYSYKKVINKESILKKYLEALIISINNGGRYTVSLINPHILLEKMISGSSLYSIYEDIGISKYIEKVITVENTELIDIYELGSINNYQNILRRIFISPDMQPFIPSEELEATVLENHVNEIIVMDLYSIPLNTDCRYNSEYIPIDFYETYMDKAGLSLDQLYPRKISIGGKMIEHVDIHNIGIVNYNGYRYAEAEKCRYIGEGLINKLLR